LYLRRPGSSPLARGLHKKVVTRRGHLRIIPARAGFTPSRPWPPSWAWGHSRSRGVYREEEIAILCGEGSSPLARGLHNPETAALARSRIIPARAGFTRS